MEDFSALLEEMEAYGRINRVPIINEQGLPVLLATVREKKPHRILEIGTAIGYSALLMAEEAAADVEIDTLELSEERAALAREYISRSPYSDRIRIHIGDAGENSQRAISGLFPQNISIADREGHCGGGQCAVSGLCNGEGGVSPSI